MSRPILFKQYGPQTPISRPKPPVSVRKTNFLTKSVDPLGNEFYMRWDGQWHFVRDLNAIVDSKNILLHFSLLPEMENCYDLSGDRRFVGITDPSVIISTWQKESNESGDFICMGPEQWHCIICNTTVSGTSNLTHHVIGRGHQNAKVSRNFSSNTPVTLTQILASSSHNFLQRNN